MIKIFRKLWKQESGATAVIFVLTMLIVIGSLALVIDVARVYSVKSKISRTAETVAAAVTRNLNFIGVADLDRLATDISENIVEATSVFAFSQSSPDLEMSITTDTTRGLVTVLASTAVPTTLLQFLSFSKDINVSEVVSGYQYAPEAEILIVIESSEKMALSKKQSNVITAISEFMSTFDNHVKEDTGISFGFLPFGSELINVAPHIEWLEAGAWPTEIPPNVVGTTNWIGDLADDRWCVLPRTGLAGRNDTTPDTVEFAVALEILKATDDIGLPHYSNVTTSDCRSDSIIPLSDDKFEILNELTTLEGSGETYSGRALVWAERVLSAAWQPFWNTSPGTPTEFDDEGISKVVILLIGSENTVPENEDPLFTSVCNRMKTNGITFYVIDYLAPENITDRLKDCATSEGYYFRVETRSGLSEAFYAIAKFLTVVRFAG